MSAESRAGLTTHVLDTSRGRPAAGLRIDLSRVEPDGRTRLVKSATTNADGRCDAPLLGPAEMEAGRYELVFHVGPYFRAIGAPTTDPPFLDQIPVRFAIGERTGHYHVPLLVSPYGYTIYRGS
ncbi:MAG: hydroxyisourate hydrolase [Candidatus Rokuibacteriota bacterium]|nr:MAG: hydroxyisourate hydrolase [Candidatus Rokubacteria bacterium]